MGASRKARPIILSDWALQYNMCAGCLIRCFGASSGTYLAVPAIVVATINACPLLLYVQSAMLRMKSSERTSQASAAFFSDKSIVMLAFDCPESVTV